MWAENYAFGAIVVGLLLLYLATVFNSVALVVAGVAAILSPLPVDWFCGPRRPPPVPQPMKTIKKGVFSPSGMIPRNISKAYPSNSNRRTASRFDEETVALG